MFPQKRSARRIVSSSLSANYTKFRRGQMILLALILAVVGIGTAAFVLALGK